MAFVEFVGLHHWTSTSLHIDTARRLESTAMAPVQESPGGLVPGKWSIYGANMEKS